MKNFCAPMIGGDVKWCNCSGKLIWQFLKKLGKELPYDSEILL
jgi:hypothetical protein